MFKRSESSPNAASAADSAAASNSAGLAETRTTAQARESTALPAPMPSPMPRAPAPAPKLGTGHGEREYSYVNYTDFVRLQTQPNEVIRIHYDSLENLFAMGIVKRPRPVPPTANPFPASPEPQFVPDPRG